MAAWPTNGLPPVRRVAPAGTLAALRATRAGERLDGSHTLGDRVVAAAFEAVRVRGRGPCGGTAPVRDRPGRGLVGADLHLGSPGGASWWVDPRDLVLRGGEPVPAVLREATVVVHPDRYPPGFGALRTSLALLEAGHVAATLALTAWRAGLTARVELGTGPTSVARITLDDGLDGPSDGRGDGLGADARGRADVVGGLEARSAAASETLQAWLDRRSAGGWASGLVGDGGVDRRRHDAVVGAVVGARAALAGVLPDDDALRVYEHRLDDDLPAVGVMRRVDRPGSASLAAGDPRLVASSGLTFTVRVDAWLDAYGDGASTVLSTALGWITQWGALAATTHRVTARPARAHDDADRGWLPGLPADQVPVHQIWLRAWPTREAARAIPSLARVGR